MSYPARYLVTETLYENPAYIVYRGVDSTDGKGVILKTLRADTPSIRDVQRLRHEYELGRQIIARCVLRVRGLDAIDSRLCLVSEDSGGVPLQRLVRRRMDLGRFLEIAIHLAEAVAELHESGIIHKDIKPANILIDVETLDLKLQDLEIAVRISQAPVRAAGAGAIEGTLPYMSPEQTGRTNRVIDHRTDLYSLGVVLYELLTGVRPFEADDPLGWVHCHIARMPKPPDELNSAIPRILSKIILKLLAKQVEDRYQSGRGLEADLVRCRDQYASSGRIEQFTLGEHDVSGVFVLPQKLRGRDDEIATLMGAFSEVVNTGRPTFLLVQGEAGVGKSSLVRELYNPIAAEHGWFIAGKFDQWRRNTPYSTLTQALGDLVRQILTVSQQWMHARRQELQAALGDSGQLIVDVIPELEQIVGKQPPVPDLPATEAQNRFSAVFRRFIAAFCSRETPLAMFLDDLQWADSGSLMLVRDLLIHGETHHLFLIGACRDNEVDPSHPLMLTLAEASRGGAVVRSLFLAPLGLAAVHQIIEDAIAAPHQHTRPLAEMVCQKTGGNSLFVVQFLAALYRERFLWFDASVGSWRWDLKEIGKKAIAGSISELMQRRLLRLPDSARDAVKVAACIGSTVEARDLTVTLSQDQEQVHADLDEAAAEGMLLRVDGTYAFAHDRVREAAYLLVPEQQRAAQHLQIGRRLQSAMDESELEARIFDLAQQFNLGFSLIEDPAEKYRVAQLNLQAGLKAQGAVAYASAVHHFTQGISQLPADAAETHQTLTFDLHFHRALCLYLNGRLAEAETAIGEAAPHAQTRLQKAVVFRLKISLHTTRGEMDKGIAAGIEAARLFGTNLPSHPTRPQVEHAYAQVWRDLRDRPIEDLISQPMLSDPETRMAMNLLADLGTPAIFAGQNLLYLTLARMVSLSIQRGNTEASVWAYVWFGASLVQRDFARYKEGYRFAKLAYDLMEKHALHGYRAKVSLMFGDNTNFYMRHFRSDRPYIHEAFRAAVDYGDMIWACYSCNHVITNMLATGDPLPEVWEESVRRLTFVRNAHDPNIEMIILSQQRYIQSLRGLTARPGSFDGDDFDQDRFESQIANSQMRLVVCWYYILKLQNCFIFNDIEGAAAACEEAGRRILSNGPDSQGCDYDFFAPLALAARHRTLPAGQQQECLKQIAAHQRILIALAENCPENFANRRDLVAAEHARITGDLSAAQELYERAITSARDNGFVQNEALACELASQFYRERRFTLTADAYLRHAYACYCRWGADGKARQLEQRYPVLAGASAMEPSVLMTGAGGLDSLALIGSLQSISRELMLPKLQETLMRTVLEVSGAQRGVLLLAEESGLTIRAIAEAKGTQTNVRLVPAGPPTSELLPLSVVDSVQRSLERLVLADASATPAYASDEYIRWQQTHSILCLPLLLQRKMVGLLYLENNLLSGAFTSDSVTVLELLGAQTAISLENARLYADLQRENAERQKAEASARESEQQIRKLVERSPIAMALTSGSDLSILMFNRMFTELFGYTIEDIRDVAHWWPLAYPDPRYRNALKATWEARIHKAIRDHSEIEPMEATVTCKDGSLRDIECGFSSIGEQHVVTFIDLTERKRAMESLTAAKEAAEDASRAKDQFIAVLSHELRTPLAPVLALTSAAASQDNLPPEIKEDMALIHRNIELETILIDDLLDFTRLTRRTMALHFEIVDAHRSVREALEISRQAIQAKDIHLKCDLSAQRHHVWADPARLQQVLWNILQNAAKFVSAEGEIAIRSRNANGRLQIEISDNGIGIDSETLPRVFDAFRQAEQTKARRYGGMGLGLTIAKGIMDLLHGEIRAFSEGADKGATFTIEMATVQQADDGAPLIAAPNTERARKGKILLVEDHADTLRIMSRLLQNWGYVVTVAKTVSAALEEAQRERFDLLISDIGLPDGSGLDVMRKLRRQYCMPGIAVSGYGTEEDIRQSMAAGFGHHLTKPVSFKTLQSVVEQVSAG